MAGCRRASSAQPGSGSQNEEYEPAAAIMVWTRDGCIIRVYNIMESVYVLQRGWAVYAPFELYLADAVANLDSRNDQTRLSA